MNAIKFKNNDNSEKPEFQYNPGKFEDTFYQICRFKNAENLYETRKIFFDEKLQITKLFEKKYDIKTINKFIQASDEAKYKIFPTDNISSVSLPNGSDFILAKSSMANGIYCENKTCNNSYDIMYKCHENNYKQSSFHSDLTPFTKDHFSVPTMDNLKLINNNNF